MGNDNDIIRDLDLRSIRLLDLHPGEPEDVLRCTIKEVSIADHPEYEAISYCWGSRYAIDAIVCDDETRLPLTESLSSALRHFRHHQQSRVLWADAICIDQSNAEEKSRQVNMMKDVFRQATRVLIWLGEETEGVSLDPYIGFANQIKDFSPSELLEFQAARLKSGRVDYEYAAALNAIIEKPWFRRVWIAQEVALASEAVVYCGHKSLTWTEFNVVLSLEFAISLQNDLIMEIIAGMKFDREAVSQGDRMTLIQVLLRHRMSLATDPRDKVYALLGLCNDDVVHADYTLSSQEVYKLITINQLRQHRNLAVISPPSNPVSPPTDQGPSWVPDWSATDVAFPMALRDRLTQDVGYQATGSSKWTGKFSEDEAMLEVEAQFIDEVAVLGTVRRPYRPGQQGMRALGQQLRVDLAISNEWQTICLGKATSWESSYPTGETLFDASWQIILAGCHPSEYEDLRSQSETLWSMFKKFLFLHRLHLLPLWGLETIERMTILTGKAHMFRRALTKALQNDYFYRVQRTISHRRMARTTTDYLGLVPALTQVGDRIVLLKGLTTPAVIRPKGQQWEFVGDAYIHGLMNGHLFRPEECTKIWLA